MAAPSSEPIACQESEEPRWLYALHASTPNAKILPKQIIFIHHAGWLLKWFWSGFGLS